MCFFFFKIIFLNFYFIFLLTSKSFKTNFVFLNPPSTNYSVSLFRSQTPSHTFLKFPKEDLFRKRREFLSANKGKEHISNRVRIPSKPLFLFLQNVCANIKDILSLQARQGKVVDCIKGEPYSVLDFFFFFFLLLERKK